jgi:1,4-alpha-glucan branching enzyme
VEPLPISEFNSPRSLGYDGSDLFSPEMDYTLEGDEVDPYLAKVNALFSRHGKRTITQRQLAVPINQLKVFVDLCHLEGVAVVLDVVYNHAGYQIGGQEESLWFFDWARGPDKNQSLYFTDREHTGPVFAFWKQEVRQFLIDNARFWFDEYHADGLRYDQVSVIVAENGESGWRFCQDCTSTLRAHAPQRPNIAEYWPVDPWVPKPASEGGAGFDAAWTDGIRSSVRDAVAAAAGGRDAAVDLARVAGGLDARVRREMAGRAIRRKPRRGLSRSRPARRAIGRRLEPAVLVCAQPCARCDRACPDRSGHSDAVHGAGVPRGRAMGR